MSVQAGNPHAAFDVAGTGNVAWSRCCDTSQPKGRGNREYKLRPKLARQSSILLIGGIVETSASFEARSAPRSYPTGNRRRATASGDPVGAQQWASLVRAAHLFVFYCCRPRSRDGRNNGGLLARKLPSGCHWNKLVSLHININEPTGLRDTSGLWLHCSSLVGPAAQLVTWAAAGKTENNSTIKHEFRTIVASD